MTARDGTYQEFDAGMFVDAFSRPGIDPREWISYGVVDQDGESEDEKAVEFDKDYGPLVNVTLHPAGKQVRARVASFMAGNGEGEWFPFIAKDEVLVALANGSERNAIIIGRMNQGVDGFPSRVGGVDTSKNAVAFRRCRTPYVWELAQGPFLITNKANNAALLMDKGGNWYLKDGEGSALHIGADWMGFTTKDTTDFAFQYQMDDKKLNISLDGGNTQMVLQTTDSSSITTSNTLNIGTAGAIPFWHATSIESVCALLDAFMKALGLAIGAIPTPAIAPAALAAIFAAAGQTTLPLAIPVAAVAPLLAIAPALQAAFAIPAVPNVVPSAAIPSLAAVGLVIG
jgi:hypothetical protein